MKDRTSTEPENLSQQKVRPRIETWVTPFVKLEYLFETFVNYHLSCKRFFINSNMGPQISYLNIPRSRFS